MHEIKLEDGGKLVLETTLTQGQVSKFNNLNRRLIVVDGSAFIPLDELHGVFLTNSREKAKAIINNYQDVVKNFLVKDKIKFEKFGVSSAIQPVGIYNLLEVLAKDNPKKAGEYRASLALLAYIIAKHPQIKLNADIQAKQQEVKRSSAFASLKRAHKFCQLCELPFMNNDEKHVHHIEGKSEDPSKAIDIDNLIVIQGYIHHDYHDFLSKQKLPISRATLKYYAKLKNYSLKAI
ncbi:MAG: hypothetical protein DSM106950_09110 [Stigonema ocellatum SAG 48.90 = DSM 106950]|nr:hypothetical protein [Stigonema ocellatum SAG 48.90 = DSM 106950]